MSRPFHQHEILYSHSLYEFIQEKAIEAENIIEQIADGGLKEAGGFEILRQFAIKHVLNSLSDFINENESTIYKILEIHLDEKNDLLKSLKDEY